MSHWLDFFWRAGQQNLDGGWGTRVPYFALMLSSWKSCYIIVPICSPFFHGHFMVISWLFHGYFMMKTTFPFQIWGTGSPWYFSSTCFVKRRTWSEELAALDDFFLVATSIFKKLQYSRWHNCSFVEYRCCYQKITIIYYNYRIPSYFIISSLTLTLDICDPPWDSIPDRLG